MAALALFRVRSRGRGARSKLNVKAKQSEARGDRGHAPPENLWNSSPLNRWKCIRNFEKVTFLWAFRLLEWVRSWGNPRYGPSCLKVGGSRPPSPCEGITFRGSAYFVNATQNNQNKLQAKGTYDMKRSGHLALPWTWRVGNIRSYIIL